MLRFRRTNEEPRIEIVPLIDVVFLVLTFFIYAMVLMIPAKVLPMRLQALSAGATGEPIPAITISITRDGTVAVDREVVAIDRLLEVIRARVAENPEMVVYIAPEAEGDADRLPLFVRIYEQLSGEGLDIRLVGALREGE